MQHRAEILAGVLALILAVPHYAHAQWQLDGVAVSSAAEDQSVWGIVSDGAGGAIITWHDYRSTTSLDIYVQRVDAAGFPLWTADGVALCTDASDQSYPTIVSDGAGGAIVAWNDQRNGNDDIFAQRVNASGVPQWTADGILLCTDTSDQRDPTIASDGAGGAIVAWHDNRSGDRDVYAQHVDAVGVPQWTADGVSLCTETGDQASPAIVSDGAGGAIVTWYDFRSGTNDDIYARRVDASGVPQWTADGVALCTEASYQSSPQIVSDGAAGAIVTWQDLRGGSTSDIYAQRVNISGSPQWTANGVALCTAANNQSAPVAATDGTGGAIVTWQDDRNTESDVFARRVDASGAAQWTADGIAVCTAASYQSFPKIVSDGAGGAIVTWTDFRDTPASGSDIYAQHAVAPPTAIGNLPPTTALVVLDNAPNPFTSTTTLRIGLPKASDVEIEVFDVAGRSIRSVRTVTLAAGWREISFDARDAAGQPLPSGVYFYRVRAAGEVMTRKMVIAR